VARLAGILKAAPALCLAVLASAQEPGFVIRTETNLALVRFHVVRKGKYVPDLRAEDIQILEDGAPQKVALLEGGGSGPRTIPVEILLLFDVSLSVVNQGLLDSIAIKETLLDGLGGNVGVRVYAFGAKLKRFCRLTRDPETLRTAVRSAYDFEHGGTRLYEAVMMTARDAAAAGANATRLMIVFSDGQPTTDTKPEDAARVARLFGIPVFPVVLGHERVARQAQGSMDPRKPPSLGQVRAMDREREMLEFARLGEMTGGRSFDPPLVNNSAVRQILEALATHVQAEYVAGFYLPAAGPKPAQHKVEVVLRRKHTGKIYGGNRAVVH
jgi:VWFA-related protein